MLATHHFRNGLWAVALALATAGPSFAQNAIDWFTTTGDWNVNNNWSGPAGNFVPAASENEFANISNGGTANFGGGPDVGGVVLGTTALQSGTLNVLDGSTLNSVSQGATNGNIVVGQLGTGTLVVQNGATVNTVGLTSGGGLASSTRLIGPTAAVNASSVTLLSNSTLITEITSSSFMPITVIGNAALGGKLKIELSGGYTPTVGTSWPIFNAATTSGSFTMLDTSTLPALPVGQKYVLSSKPGGLGTQVNLSLEQLLALNVNRTSGAVTISNPSGAPATNIDGYTIGSSIGSMNAANWVSLHDQFGSVWFESNQGNNRLTELRTAGDIAISGGTELTLGNVYSPANPAFGVPIEDLTFDYEKADGSVITGFVNYTNGPKKYNNLVLEINSAGVAQILNDSQHAVSIEGYTIGSSDSSLLTGTWSSLTDQSAAGGNWMEANPLPGRISEFKQSGAATLNTTNGVNIGQIFNTAGSQAGVTFEFLIAGESTPLTGIVTFRDLSSITPIGPGSAPGDFNDDGHVNAADYVVWRKTMASNMAKYNEWRMNFGNPPGSGSLLGGPAAVPEPAFAWLLAIGVPAVIGNVRRLGRQRK